MIATIANNGECKEFYFTNESKKKCVHRDEKTHTKLKKNIRTKAQQAKETTRTKNRHTIKT